MVSRVSWAVVLCCAAGVVGLGPMSRGASSALGGPGRVPASHAVKMALALEIARRDERTKLDPRHKKRVKILEGDFSGEWQLERSVNFDASVVNFDTSTQDLGSPVGFAERSSHRSSSTKATVEHRIRCLNPDAFEVCVKTRLGTTCESFVVGGKEPVESKDARGEPVTKYVAWEGPTRRVIVTKVASTVGTCVDKRGLTTPNTMVMELISPSNVVAFRYFTRKATS